MIDLQHEYDAAKRREYYLRTRQLKGRQKAKRKITAEQRRHQLQVRVERLKAKLAQLEESLRVLREAAQRRSGIDKNSAEKAESKYNSSATSSTKYRDLTAKQKRDKAKAAEKYREENQTLTQQVKSLNSKISNVRERIKRIKETGSVGYSKSDKN